VRTTHTAAQHFVQDNTESPKVRFKAVIAAKENLWRRERRCANTATRDIRIRGRVVKQPRNAEVAKYNMPICVDEDVFGLKISVNNIVGMNVLNSKKLDGTGLGEDNLVN
jgi:hypothetical protein